MRKKKRFYIIAAFPIVEIQNNHSDSVTHIFLYSFTFTNLSQYIIQLFLLHVQATASTKIGGSNRVFKILVTVQQVHGVVMPGRNDVDAPC